MSRTLMTLLLAATMAGAHAQTVWRCGPDGRSYADAPCAEGQVVAVADPRSKAEVAAAHAVLQKDRLLVRQLAEERREREREAASRGSGLTGIGRSAVVKPKAASRPLAQRPAAKHRPPAGAGTSPAIARGSLQKLD